MKTYSLFLLLLLYGVSIAAQKPPAKFGKPDESEFAQSVCPIDSGADAYYIFDYASVRFDYNVQNGWTWIMERHSKLRIVNDNGKDNANIIIPYFEAGTNKEYIYGLKGYTYNMVDGKLVKTRLTKDQIFDEDITDNSKRQKISMPDVKAGSIIEISYSLISDFWAYLRDWEFQKDIPVLYSEFYIGFPEYYQYNSNMKGYESLTVNENTAETATLSIPGRDANGKMTTNTVTYTVYKKHLVAENLPALKEEPYVTTMENYRSSIEFELSSIRYPQSPVHEYTTDWDAVIRYLLNHNQFGMKLDHAGFAKSDIKDLADQYPEQYERMVAIFDMVKNRIKWDGRNGMYSSRSLREVYNEQNGSAMDINFILINLLRAADIQAYPVALSTRKNGIILPTFPTVDKFNYVIALAVIDGKQILLDATDPYCPAGVLPPRCLNGSGRIIDDKLNTWIELNPGSSYTNIMFYELALGDEGTFSGKISNQLKGYSAMKFKNKKDESQSLDKLIEDMQEENPGLVIDSFNIDGLNEKISDIKAVYHVNINDRSDQIGDIISFCPLFYDKMNENPFKLEERKFPVDFNYPLIERLIIQVKIPEGYTVESLPEKVAFGTPSKDAIFTYAATHFGETISINVRYQIDKTLFLPDEYKIIREFFARMVAKEAEMVTLKRISPQAGLVNSREK